MLDIQTILDNAVKAQRAEEMKTSIQLTLGEIILKLEAVKNKKLLVVFDVGKYHPIAIDSWRGSYRELAFEYGSKQNKLSVAHWIKRLKKAVGETFIGYKGGDFLMGKATPIWVANYGTSMGFRRKDKTAVIDILESKDKDKTAVIDILESKDRVIIKTKAIEC